MARILRSTASRILGSRCSMSARRSSRVCRSIMPVSAKAPQNSASFGRPATALEIQRSWTSDTRPPHRSWPASRIAPVAPPNREEGLPWIPPPPVRNSRTWRGTSMPLRWTRPEGRPSDPRCLPERPHRPQRTGWPPRGDHPACWRAEPGFRSRATRRRRARRLQHGGVFELLAFHNCLPSFSASANTRNTSARSPVESTPANGVTCRSSRAQGDGSVRTSRSAVRGRSRSTDHSRIGCDGPDAIDSIRARVCRARSSTATGSRCRCCAIARWRARERRSSRVIGG